MTVLSVAAVLAGTVVGMRRYARHRWSQATLAAVIVTVVAVHLKLLVLLHPGVTGGDTGFHANRLALVAGGTWLFTSAAPGGEFPYPAGLYISALPILEWTSDPRSLLRTIVAVTNGVAGLLLYLAAGRTWGARAGLAALALFHVLPQNLQIQAVAYLTNAFANDLAVIAIAALALAVETAGRRRLAWTAVSTMAGVGAALSHTSSGVILVATLALIGVLLLARGATQRRSALAALAVAVLVAGLAWALYYRHFMPTYRALATRPPTSDSVSAPAPPAMRAEAHQTRWVPGRAAMAVRAAAVPRYLTRYYGLPGILLGALGLGLMARRWRGDSLAAIGLAWAVAVLAFLVVGVLSPIDLRYYLAGYPLVALAGGFAVDTAVARGGWHRHLVIALLGVSIVAAALAWWSWLGTPDF